MKEKTLLTKQNNIVSFIEASAGLGTVLALSLSLSLS
jgi:hypothetical protein